MKKTHFIFDLDGTLTDPKEGITKSVQYALRQYGIAAKTEELLPFIGPPLAKSFQDFYGFAVDESYRAVEKYREYFADTGIFENEVYEGIPALLSTLKEKNASLFIASSKPTVYVERILEHFSLKEYFTFVGGSLLSGERVEKDDVLRYVLSENCLTPEECVMIGDRKFDIEGAKAFGMTSVGVLYGYGTHEEITSAKPDKIAETPKELLEILLNL